MESGTIRVLLVEDSNFDVFIIKDMLGQDKNNFKRSSFEIVRAKTFQEAKHKLLKEYFDIILLDLTLPDSFGLDTLKKIYSEVPEIPIIILTSLNDQLVAIKAVKEGAQDYLVKGQFDANLLLRSIHYSIERHKMLVALRSMALIDQLTSLYNRRGFLNLANHHISLAKRKKRNLLFLFCDLDNFKFINDNYGHLVGDSVLKDISLILKDAFRESDIIARFGGDEFVVLALDVKEEDRKIIIDRLESKIKDYNNTKQRPYTLSMSIGAVFYGPDDITKLEDILDKADKLMYEQKKKNKGC
ncbi:GGDEF domain-containing response regulator [Paramaledivibacter caminithermalis]|jgi:diguanylate cyclase (GGDEF)-like protein|uniref:Stage 0 sporulation protein A homolog n=1 Tax=Paramaledivibacter caminithermalis (strain DSM 15212 / CIP 107654 / DViRD3) TaxID=1121301 RepID=A0A1M6PRZ8_PARC5|nr:diguanylate cyclase response regulator [Paramaledivibacter caminithermalis]SHK10744.1 diguanylate cyclase (GGDEF) domain-containing protein [Paramaledivibacter caminithermalis DSM 15212]